MTPSQMFVVKDLKDCGSKFKSCDVLLNKSIRDCLYCEQGNLEAKVQQARAELSSNPESHECPPRV